MAEYGFETQKSGYLDIKQSSKVKARHLKAWKRRWVVVKKLTDLAAGKQTARIDVYPSEAVSHLPEERLWCFALDNLSAVQNSTSRTHPFAFELLDLEPVVVLSGSSREESAEWITALRNMFFADESIRDTDSYKVTIQPNTDSLRFELRGDYTLTISPEGVSLWTRTPNRRATQPKRTLTMDNPLALDSKEHRRSSSYESDQKTQSLKRASSSSSSSSYGQMMWKSGGGGGGGLGVVGGEENEEEEDEEDEVLFWRLCMLKRFDVERKSGQPLIFLIDCGPISTTGEATFRFLTDQAYRILASFRKCISRALERRRHQDRYASTPDLRPHRTRTVSTVTGYQSLLDRSARSDTLTGAHSVAESVAEQGESGAFMTRSWSMSSSSTTTPVSPTLSNPGEMVMAGRDSPRSELKEKGGVPILPRRQRISVVSMPAGILSSSPQNSERFGGYAPPTFPNNSPKSHDQFDGFMQQMQQQQQLQQQLQQQQLQQHQLQQQQLQQQQLQLQGQSWPVQQVPVWSQQQMGSPFLPPQPFPPLPPTPVAENPQQAFFTENPQQAFMSENPHQQQVQLWLQHLQQQQQQQQLQQQGQQPASSCSPLPNRMRLRRNSSVPNLMTLVNTEIRAGYEKIDEDVLLRRRTSSLTADQPFASGSICSADSGVVIDPANPRKGSNSFGSSVSTESSRSGRKPSEMASSPIQETPPTVVAAGATVRGVHPLLTSATEDKSSTTDIACHVYQDLDSVKAEAYLTSRRRSSCVFELGRRRHSTGDVSHSDYEELDSVKRTIALTIAGEGSGSLKKDLPPELPARPPSFYGLGKPQSQGTKGLSAALGVLQGLRSISFRDSKQRDNSSEETLTSIKQHYMDGVLSRSGSMDIYETIGDIDSKTFRRNSSDITPEASHPDLRSVDRSVSPRSKAATGLESSSSSGDLEGFGARKRSRIQSLNLLSFSDCDMTQIGGLLSGHKGDASDSISALMDFFFDDSSFHSNPMVTGAMKTREEPVPPPLTPTMTPSSPDQSAAPKSSPQGWANFSEFPSGGVKSPGLQPSSDPFQNPSSRALVPFTGESPVARCLAERDPVYVDMRNQPEQQTADTACEYVTSEDVNRDEHFANFVLFQ